MTPVLRVDTDEEALVDALQTDGIDGWSWATAGITILVAFIASRILKYVSNARSANAWMPRSHC